MKEVVFNGPCPFLTCRQTGPHSHPVCPECGAVCFGNIFCRTCWVKALADRLKAIQKRSRPRTARRLRRFHVVPNTRPFSFSIQLYKRDVLGGIRELGPRVARKEPQAWLTRELHRIGYHSGTEYDFTPFYQDTRYPEKEHDGSNI